MLLYTAILLYKVSFLGSLHQGAVAPVAVEDIGELSPEGSLMGSVIVALTRRRQKQCVPIQSKVRGQGAI